MCHICDNPSCVNPKHLFLGTGSDNQIDSAKKGRKISQKLNEEKVRQIRLECVPNHPDFGFSALGRKHNVNPAVIWHIYYRKRWARVSDNTLNSI